MGISSQSFTTTTTTLFTTQPHSFPTSILLRLSSINPSTTHQQHFKMSIQSIILALFTFVAMIAAVPTNFNVFQRSDACGAGSTAHCCNDETAQAVTNHDGLSPDVGGIKNLLGQCSDITVAVIGGAVPIKNMCKQTAVCCGDMEQNGIVNFGCTPINAN